MFSKGQWDRIVGNVPSVHGVVISSVTDFDSPDIVLNDTPYLKES